MTLTLQFSAATLATFSAIIIVYSIFFRRSKRFRFPPGPPPLPIIGNVLDMPTVTPWATYKEWSKQYKSDIIYVNMAGQHMIIVNSLDILNDLLDKRGSIYSSRPPLTMVNDLMGWAWDTAFEPYSETWKLHRKAFSQEINVNSVQRFNPQQVKATNELLRNLIHSPERWEKHLRHQLGAIMIDIAFGMDVLAENDPHIQAAEKAVAALVSALVPGKYLVDSLPILKYIPSWFPGAGFKRKAKLWKQMTFESRDLPWDAFKKLSASGDARPSLSLFGMQNIDKSCGDVEYQENVIKEAASVFYVAGVDTTVSAHLSLVYLMLEHPDVQAKIHDELDTVLGRGHIPTFGDEDSLPYLMAVVKETLRWQPPLPFAVPHLLTREDTYKGYTFPAGTTIIPNSWAVLHDEKAYPDPLVWKPERFLTKDGKLNPDVQDPELAVFGFGRRICPGQHLAKASFWLTAGSLLAAFDIQRPVDKEGNVINPPGTYSSGFVTYPDPFECKFVPRFPELLAMVDDL